MKFYNSTEKEEDKGKQKLYEVLWQLKVENDINNKISRAFPKSPRL